MADTPRNTDTTSVRDTTPKTIVAVGMFDGVHIGHRFVLEQLCAQGRRLGLVPAVVTFFNHPRGVIQPQATPGLIYSQTKRIDEIRNCGVDEILVLPFDNALRRMDAAQFARDILIDRMNAGAVLVGYDNGFGSDRLRGVEAYREALAPLGLEVFQCAPCPARSVSSSMVRKALAQGDIAEVTSMLGRPFELTGTVVKGRQLGRTIGFPTANIRVPSEMMLPRNGVYAAKVILGPESVLSLPAMINIGTNPTVNLSQGQVSVEAHIIGIESDNLDLYGRQLGFALISRLRDERRFASLDSLRNALKADRQAALDAYNQF